MPEDAPARAAGTGRSEPVEISREVREEIYEHVFSSPDAEVAGVLVGPPSKSGPIIVSGRIEASDADNQLASVTFTHESWSAIYEDLEKNHDGMEIVGWYHSHPGFGIFLSDHDLFIHQNFFSGERQVAFVVDPLSAEEGIFGWDGGAVEKLSERPTDRKPVTREAPTRPVATQAPSRRTRMLAGVIALLIFGAIIGVGVGLLLTSGNRSEKSKRDAKTISSLQASLTAARAQLAETQGNTSAPVTKVDIETTTYRVKPGDTLTSIAQQSLGSASYAPLIAGVNGISDENAIAEGTELRVPTRATATALTKAGGR